jgi:hypothetical protein
MSTVNKPAHVFGDMFAFRNLNTDDYETYWMYVRARPMPMFF